jgi:hypothetical protein
MRLTLACEHAYTLLLLDHVAGACKLLSLDHVVGTVVNVNTLHASHKLERWHNRCSSKHKLQRWHPISSLLVTCQSSEASVVSITLSCSTVMSDGLHVCDINTSPGIGSSGLMIGGATSKDCVFVSHLCVVVTVMHSEHALISSDDTHDTHIMAI